MLLEICLKHRVPRESLTTRTCLVVILCCRLTISNDNYSVAGLLLLPLVHTTTTYLLAYTTGPRTNVHYSTVHTTLHYISTAPPGAFFPAKKRRVHYM
jgi:hypothetical protein